MADLKGNPDKLRTTQGQRTFTGAKSVTTEFLTKKNPVRKAMDEPIRGKKDSGPVQKVTQAAGRNGAAPKVKRDMSSQPSRYQPKFAQPVTKRGTSYERPSRGEHD